MKLDFGPFRVVESKSTIVLPQIWTSTVMDRLRFFKGNVGIESQKNRHFTGTSCKTFSIKDLTIPTKNFLRHSLSKPFPSQFLFCCNL